MQAIRRQFYKVVIVKKKKHRDITHHLPCLLALLLVSTLLLAETCGRTTHSDNTAIKMYPKEVFFRLAAMWHQEKNSLFLFVRGLFVGLMCGLSPYICWAQPAIVTCDN